MNEREQKLWDAIEAVAAENPDFVYDPGRNGDNERNDCSYFPSAMQPSPCIIGVALGRVDSPPTWADEGTSALMVLVNHGFEDKKLRHFADSVQLKQDQGMAWGKAVADSKVWIDEVPMDLLR